MFKKLKNILGRENDKLRTRSNAGDRRHGRKNVRKTRRDKLKGDKQARKLEKIALRRANKGTTFGSFLEKVGPIVNQFVGRKQEGQEVESGFMNEDGTFEGRNGVAVKPNANDKMYLSNHAAEQYSEAGGNPYQHNDFTDKDGDGKDDVTGLSEIEHNKLDDNQKFRKSLTPSESTKQPYNWKKLETENLFSWLWRLIKDKPIYLIPSILLILVGFTYGFVKIFKKIKHKTVNKTITNKKY